MQILDIDKYSNHLEFLNLSSADIERQILHFKLLFLKTKHQEVEWAMSFPIFLKCFYKYVYVYQAIPSQKVFFRYYIDVNHEWFNSQALSTDILQGLKARLYRTYPSLIRDFHFSKRLSEKIKDSKIIYNTNLDVREGIDLLIIKDEVNIAVNLYTNTKRALKARLKKESRHRRYKNVTYIELPVDFNGSLKIGDFYLYGDRELTHLEAEIKKVNLT